MAGTVALPISPHGVRRSPIRARGLWEGVQGGRGWATPGPCGRRGEGSDLPVVLAAVLAAVGAAVPAAGSLRAMSGKENRVGSAASPRPGRALGGSLTGGWAQGQRCRADPRPDPRPTGMPRTNVSHAKLLRLW